MEIKSLSKEEIIKKRKEIIKDSKIPSIIYGYFCKITNKWYIGQTIKSTLSKRARCGNGYINSHGKEMSTKFANAIKEFGWENFIPYVFNVCDIKNADAEENKYIKLYDSLLNGYNSQSGGKNHFNHTQETKDKIRNMKKGEKNYNYGVTTSPKQKEVAKIIASTILQRPEVIKKRNEHIMRGENHYLYGKHHSIETKEKLSKSLKGKNKYGNNGLAKKIYCITDNKIFSCAKECADYYGLTSGTSITACCTGKRKRAKGKEFVYYEKK